MSINEVFLVRILLYSDQKKLRIERNSAARIRNKHSWKSGNNTIETTDIQLAFLYPYISANHQEHALNQFPETTFILPANISEAKELVSIYEIQVTGEINMSQEDERPRSDDKEWFKELKDKS